jgi:hypothetical protein
MNGNKAMMYRVPRPSRSNGVKLHTIGDHEIGIEYTEGEPVVGKLAYDSAYGITSKITFKPRRDYAAIVADAVRRVDAEDAAMPKAGKPPIGNSKMQATPIQYDDEASEVISNLMSYLEDKLTPEQLEGVTSILSSGDAPDNDSGEPHNYQATDRRTRRPAAWGAHDQARRRPMTDRNEAAYLKMFPNAGRLA